MTTCTIALIAIFGLLVHGQKLDGPAVAGMGLIALRRARCGQGWMARTTHRDAGSRGDAPRYDLPDTRAAAGRGGRRGVRTGPCAVLAGGLLALAPGWAAAQPAESADMPRTSWDRPDLGGVWVNGSTTPLERPESFGDREFLRAGEAEELPRQLFTDRLGPLTPQERALSVEGGPARAGGGPLSRRTSLVTGPTGRIPPFTPAAQERLADGLNQFITERADSHEDRGYSERCLRFVSGGPPMMAFGVANVHHIFQTPDLVAFLHEEGHVVRIIHLDARPRIDARIRLWSGDSRGRWEGDTLVVETTNFNGIDGFRGSGPGLHLIERLTRVDDETILYEFTVDDPETWTEPWSVEMPLLVSAGRLYEHACHEGNYSLVNILRGARVQEREAGAR